MSKLSFDKKKGILTFDNPLVSKPKKEKQDKRTKERIFISGSKNWRTKKQIRIVLAALQKDRTKNIEFVFSGSALGAECLGIAVAKELSIPVFEVHNWWWLPTGIYVRLAFAFKILKPTLILFFGDMQDRENELFYSLEKLSGKLLIPMRTFQSTKVKK